MRSNIDRTSLAGSVPAGTATPSPSA
jgi:hypothetical protein